MIEILPNWHPVFVHFTIALLSMSVLFYLIQSVLPVDHRWQTSISLLSKTNLWLGTTFAFVTAVAGWFAYNSVTHDTPSHAAMTDHRNWALVTLGVFIILTFWSSLFRGQKKAPLLFMIALLIAGGLLATTGWKGAESVYRYGLGVMSMPKSSGKGHAHQHADGEGHGDTGQNVMESPMGDTPIDSVSQTENVPHQHASGENHSDTNQASTETPMTDATSEAMTQPEISPHQHTSGESHANVNEQATPTNQPKSSHNSTPHTH